MDGIASGIVPVVVVRDDPGVGKPVVIHQGTQGGTDLGFLRGSKYTCRIGGVIILGLVLRELS